MCANTVRKVSVTPCAAAYPSIDAAIAAGNRQYHAAAKACEAIAGDEIKEVAWTDQSAFLVLSGGKTIRLSSSTLGTAWSVEPDMPSFEEQWPKEILLQFSNSHEVVRWNRAQLLEERVHHAFSRIVRSEFGLLLYVEGCTVLLFSDLVDIERKSTLLYWGVAE